MKDTDARIIAALSLAKSSLAMMVEAANRADKQARIEPINWKEFAASQLSVRDFENAHKAKAEIDAILKEYYSDGK